MTTKSYAEVMDPKNAHRLGMHTGAFIECCSMCHVEDRRTEVSKETKIHDTIFRTALDWLRNTSPQSAVARASGCLKGLYEVKCDTPHTEHHIFHCTSRLSLPIAFMCTHAAQASSGVASTRNGYIESLTIRDAFCAFVHTNNGLKKLEISLSPNACTYMVVAQLESSKPIVYHSRNRLLIDAFAGALCDGFAEARYKTIQRIYESVDTQEAIFVAKPNTSRVVVVYFYTPNLASWNNASYTIHEGLVTTDSSGVETLNDGGYESTALDSSWPEHLISMGMVDLTTVDPDALAERRWFAARVSGCDVDKAAAVECTRCKLLTETMTNIRKQRDEMSAKLDKLTIEHSQPPPQLESDTRSSTCLVGAEAKMLGIVVPVGSTDTDELARLREALRMATLDASETHSNLARCEAELQLLRDDEADKQKLGAALEEVRRQNNLVKRERTTEKNAQVALRRVSITRINELEHKLADVTSSLSQSRTDMLGLTRANAALATLNEALNVELEAAHSATNATESETIAERANACAVQTSLKTQIAELQERLAVSQQVGVFSRVEHDEAHTDTSCTVEMVTKSTSTYTDTKSGSIDIEPSLMERVDRIATLEAELAQAEIRILELKQDVRSTSPSVEHTYTAHQIRSQIDTLLAQLVSLADVRAPGGGDTSNFAYTNWNSSYAYPQPQMSYNPMQFHHQMQPVQYISHEMPSPQVCHSPPHFFAVNQRPAPRQRGKV